MKAFIFKKNTILRLDLKHHHTSSRLVCGAYEFVLLVLVLVCELLFEEEDSFDQLWAYELWVNEQEK